MLAEAEATTRAVRLFPASDADVLHTDALWTRHYSTYFVRLDGYILALSE
jgi:hypothetical protein